MSAENQAPPVACPRCGAAMRAAVVNSAIWIDERVFVVEDIPAQVCDNCVEQFYDEDVTDAIRRLTEQGFPAAEATREITVPVFSLTGRIMRRRPPTEEELMADY